MGHFSQTTSAVKNGAIDLGRFNSDAVVSLRAVNSSTSRYNSAMEDRAGAIGDADDSNRLVLAHSPRFRAIFAKARKSLDAGKGIPHDEFWKTVKARTRSKAKSSRSKRSNGDAA